MISEVRAMVPVVFGKVQVLSAPVRSAEVRVPVNAAPEVANGTNFRESAVAVLEERVRLPVLDKVITVVAEALAVIMFWSPVSTS